MRKKHSNQDTENPSFELIFGFGLKEADALLPLGFNNIKESEIFRFSDNPIFL